MTEYKWCHKASGEFTACLSLFDLLSICGVLSICLWLMKQLKRFNYLSLLNGKSYQNGLRVPSQTLKGFGGTLNCMCWALGVSCPLCTEVFFNCSPLGATRFHFFAWKCTPVLELCLFAGIFRREKQQNKNSVLLK